MNGHDDYYIGLSQDDDDEAERRRQNDIDYAQYMELVLGPALDAENDRHYCPFCGLLVDTDGPRMVCDNCDLTWHSLEELAADRVWVAS